MTYGYCAYHEIECDYAGQCIECPHNAKEDIEWFVFEKEGLSLLLVSKYALDSKMYDWSNARWTTCSLRKWLNEVFLIEAFSSEERKLISPMNETKDMVFILDTSQPYRYFSSDDERKCIPTEYAKAQGAHTSGGVCCWWLLREDSSSYAPCIRYEGNQSHGLHEVYDQHYGVRPAIWIDLGRN